LRARRGLAATLLVALVALLVAPVGAFGAATDADATLPDIEDEVMCPICGTALNLAESPQAERERAFIRERIAEGLDKEQIKDALVTEYGSEVLAVPETSGFDLAAWVVPGLAVIVAGAVLLISIRRWRRSSGGGPDGDEPPPAAGSPRDEERLDTDLARYDL
jgi:cytochrome c-type biogenesis protein CcmH